MADERLVKPFQHLPDPQGGLPDSEMEEERARERWRSEEGLPTARHREVLSAEVDGELVVMDAASQRSHVLNRTAALVWQHADGATPVAELAAMLERELKAPAGDELVQLALGQLWQARLLQMPAGTALSQQPLPPAAGEERRPRLPRRELLRTLARAGVAAALLPVVTSIRTPTTEAAGSIPASTTTLFTTTSARPPTTTLVTTTSTQPPTTTLVTTTSTQPPTTTLVTTTSTQPPTTTLVTTTSTRPPTTTLVTTTSS